MKNFKNGKFNTKLLVTLLLCVALLVVGIFTLTSCLEVEEDTVDHIEISPDSPKEIILGGFDIADYQINVVYNSGEVKTVPMTSDMITDAEILKTYHFGDQTLSFSYLGQTAEFTLTVKRYSFDDSITLPDMTYDYTGSAFSLSVAGALPEGTTVSFPKGNSFTNAGRYTITAVLVNDMYVTKTVTGTLTIQKVDFDMSQYEVSFDNGSFVYDGTPKSISVISNLPSFVAITYNIGKAETNSMLDVGEYIVTASFDAGVNYNHIENMTATLTITKGRYDTSAVKFENATFTYDGTIHRLAISNPSALPKGVSVVYENNGQITAGSYTVIAHFVGDAENFEPIEDMTATLYITKANVTVKDVKLASASFVYDKTPKAIYYTGTLPAGVSFEGYEYYLLEGEKQTAVSAMIDVGTYLVKAKFVYKDLVNYNAITPVTAQVEITKADITGVVFADATFEWDGLDHVISASNVPKGVTVTYQNNKQSEIGQYQAIASFTLSESVAKNYNNLADIVANITITKAKFGSEFKDKTFSYDGQNHTMEVTKVNALGETVGEDLPEGVSVFYTYYDDNNKLQMFEGSTVPTTAIVYANYTVDSAHSEYVRAHYELDYDTDMIVTVNNKSYNVIAQKAAAFAVTKATYYPSFVNQMTAYTGSAVTVKIDETNDKAHYPNLDFAGNVYTNNVQTEVGFYSGYVTIKLTETAKQYYYEETAPVEFYYAIRNAKTALNPEGTKVVYSIAVDESAFTDVVYEEGKDFKVYPDFEAAGLPKGIIINITYPDVMDKPGSYAVRITGSYYDDGNDDIYHVSYGDVASYYWAFPNKFKLGTNGSYHFILAYTIIEKEWEISYTTEDSTKLAYDGKNKTVIENDLPSWITVYYYESVQDPTKSDGEMMEVEFTGATTPGTYHLRAHPVITDATKDEYYCVSDTELDLVICKGNFTGYSIGGDVVNYDGKLHNIIIYGLPDGITYTTSLGGVDEGVSEVGVYKDVIVYFHNESPYYNDLLNLKVDLTIENNVVDLSAITVYSRSTGLKNIKQFTTLKELLGKYVDLTGATVAWTCDYFISPSMQYPTTDTLRHGSSETMDDFVFNEYTVDDQFVYVDFTINLGKGYVFNDLAESKTFTGYFNLYVGETIRIDAENVFEKFYNETTYHVDQFQTLPSVFEELLSANGKGNFTVSSWKAQYYNGSVAYPDSYTDCHGQGDASAIFTFKRNTWKDRYVLITYTIEANDGYCFYDGSKSYRTISSKVKCLVTTNVVEVDSSFLSDFLTTTASAPVEIPRYNYFFNYLNEYIDIENIRVTYSIYVNGNTQQKRENGDFYFGSNIDAFNLNCVISALTEENIRFSDTLDKTILIDNKAFTVQNVNTSDLHKENLDLINEKTIKQYKNLKDYVLLERVMSDGEEVVTGNAYAPENATYTWRIIAPDGTITTGTSEDDYTFELSTGENSYYTIELVFTAQDGYILLDDDEETPSIISTYTKTLHIYVSSVATVDLSSALEYASTTHTLRQYSGLDDLVNLLNAINKSNNNVVDFKWDVTYYKNDAIDTDKTAYNVKNSTSVYRFTTSAQESNNEYVLVEVSANLNEEGDYVLSTSTRYSYRFSIKYYITPINKIDTAPIDAIKGQSYSYPVGTRLQSIYYDFGLDDTNMSPTTYSYFKTIIRGSGSGTGSGYGGIGMIGGGIYSPVVTYVTENWSTIYSLSKESRVIYIKLTPNDGYLFVDGNNIGYDTYSFTVTLVGYEQQASTLTFADSEKNNVTCPILVEKQTGLSTISHSLINNYDSVSRIDYHLEIYDKTYNNWYGGDVNGTLYNHSNGSYSYSDYYIEANGNYRVTFTITTEPNTSSVYYVVQDKNGDIVASTGVTYTFVVYFTVQDPIEIDLTDFYEFWLGDNKDHYYISTNTQIMTDYLFYHIDSQYVKYAYAVMDYYTTSQTTYYVYNTFSNGAWSANTVYTNNLQHLSVDDFSMTAKDGYIFRLPDGSLYKTYTCDLDKDAKTPYTSYSVVDFLELANTPILIREDDSIRYAITDALGHDFSLPTGMYFNYTLTTYYSDSSTTGVAGSNASSSSSLMGLEVQLNSSVEKAILTFNFRASTSGTALYYIDYDELALTDVVNIPITFDVRPATINYYGYSYDYFSYHYNSIRQSFAKDADDFPVTITVGQSLEDAFQLYNIEEGTLYIFAVQDALYYQGTSTISSTYSDISDGKLENDLGTLITASSWRTSSSEAGLADNYYLVVILINDLKANTSYGLGYTEHAYNKDGAMFSALVWANEKDTSKVTDLSYAHYGVNQLPSSPKSVAEFDDYITVGYGEPFLSDLIVKEGVSTINITVQKISYDEDSHKDVVVSTDTYNNYYYFSRGEVDHDFSHAGNTTFTSNGYHSTNCFLVTINYLVMEDGYTIISPTGEEVTEIENVYFYVVYDSNWY